MNQIYLMDCIEGMKLLPDESIDMILCDLPYGVTRNTWDTIIPFPILWEQYERIIKNKGAIVLTANANFTNKVINSNPKLYRYKWVWVKNNATNPMNAKNKPMSQFEEILVFSKGNTANGGLLKMHYFPQGLCQSARTNRGNYKQTYENYPRDVLYYNRDPTSFHPTQKPVSLFEYLIRTYTRQGDIVLDNCMGSGTTAIACINAKRQYIGFETNEKYYKKSLERIKNNTTQLHLFW
jgi:DNA modification methylase